MSYRTVRHLCGHDARYRLSGSRSLVEHHLHELERSPCTPCAEATRSARRHIYLGVATRVIAFPTPSTDRPGLPAEVSSGAKGASERALVPDQRRAIASA